MPDDTMKPLAAGLPAGKLPSKLLARVLAPLAAGTVRRVVLGAAIGEDAAALDMAGGAGILVAAADPITFATERIGWYAVHVNANDVAATGATPLWFLATVLLPEGTTPPVVDQIFTDLRRACAALDVTLIGGHTEVTYGLPRPLIAGCMLGEVAPQRLVASGGARPGDRILLLGTAGIEGTAVLAREAASALRAAGVGEADLARARAFLDDPGISIVAAARALCAAILPHAMHDVTEGGVAGGLREVALASRVGLRVDGTAIPITPLTAQLCAALDLHPWGLLGSGALLAAVDAADVALAMAAAAREGVACAAIGTCTEEPDLLVYDRRDRVTPLPDFARDEVARYLA